MEQKTGTIAYFCPDCGSPSVSYSPLVGSKASCEACGWSGTSSELLAHAFEHDHGTDTDVAIAFTNDVRRAYGQAAGSFAEVLLKWGFFDGKNTKMLARYVAAMALASVQALLNTRKEIEKEKARGH